VAASHQELGEESQHPHSICASAGMHLAFTLPRPMLVCPPLKGHTWEQLPLLFVAPRWRIITAVA